MKILMNLMYLKKIVIIIIILSLIKRMVYRVKSDFNIVIIVSQALVYKIKEIKLMKQGYITT